MVTWVLRCKLYPEATPWRNIWFARPFRGGGLILRAIAGLDRWLSRQNPAYRPVSQPKKQKHRSFERCFSVATLVYKPGSVLTAIYLALQLLAGSSRLLEAVGSTCMLLHGVAPDRVYIVKPMSPWAGWALTPPFHPYLAAVYLCCTCPRVTPGRRYLLSLPYEARTFLTRFFSESARGCPTWLRLYCNPGKADCQISCKIFCFRIYYMQTTGKEGFK